jgi:lipid II:glycine glycyltransferase (peptidoglycan interpeptide bridge formation enzyme)
VSRSSVVQLDGDGIADWDAHAVDVAGGHVLQSRAWAEHRSASGWRPLFLATCGTRAMVLTRGWTGVPGGSAYIPRGPVGPGTPWHPGSPAGTAIGAALDGIANHVERAGLDVLAADPEVRADDTAFGEAVGAAGYHAIPEIQPSRHRMALPLPPGADEAAVFGGIAKATRQRIRRAERDGVVVLRWDARGVPHEGLLAAEDGGGAVLDRFYGLLDATGDRLGFGLPGRAEFTTWWRRALAAGHLVYLEAREGSADGDVLGGLVLYRHGTRLSTGHSADRADRRRDHPGTMHLLRWRAIQLALAEGRDEMDLGGVDVPGARRIPLEGEPTYGLYEHKRSFGAQWVELAGARETVIHAWRYRAGRLTGRLARTMGRGRARG